MATRRKRRPPPLHVSQHLIEEEKRQLAQRTLAKLDSLRTPQSTRAVAGDEAERATTYVALNNPHHQCVLTTICFCLWLVIINLLYLQWLYLYMPAQYKV